MKRLWFRLIASLPLSDATVLITNGRATAKRGRVRSALLSELAELVTSHGISDACIYAANTGKSGFRLSLFGIPGNLRQRVRNVWGANWR